MNSRIKLGILTTLGLSFIDPAIVDAAPVTDEQAIATLQLEVRAADLAATKCEGGDFLKGLNEQVTTQLQTGDFIRAASSAYVLAGYTAVCALQLRDRDGLPAWSERVGNALAVSALASHKLMQDTTVTSARAERARVLLRYAAENGSANASELLASLARQGLVKARQEPPLGVQRDVAWKGTSLAAAQRYAANALTFKQSYGGKILEITGPVLRISELSADNQPSGMLELAGIQRPNKDDATIRDDVECIITDPDALQRAVQLKKNQKVRVTGLYEPNKMDFRVSLQDCRVH